MSFNTPFSFGGPPTRTPTSSTHTGPSSMAHQHAVYGSPTYGVETSQFVYIPSPYPQSPPAGMYGMDLNESQFEEVVYDSQPIPNIDPHSTPTTDSLDNPTHPLPPQNRAPGQQHEAPSAGGKRRGRAAPNQPKNTASRFHWDIRSTVILIEVKRASEENRFQAGVGGRSKTTEEKWADITRALAARGVFVDWKIANDKWKRLTAIHKEIADWERNTPSGKSSYWQMSPKERKEEGRFGHLNFEKDLFDVMEQHFGKDPSVNPPASVIDTTNMAQNRHGTSPIAASQDASEVEQESMPYEQTPSNGGVGKKTRKRTHVYDVGLKEATRDIGGALEVAEDRRDRRHKETFEQNNDMLDIERNKVEMGMRFASSMQGLTDVLKIIAQKL